MNGSADKFKSMIGFAKRSGKIAYGLDTVKSAKKLYMLAVSDTASKNLTDNMITVARRRSIPLLRVPELERIVGNNCKALGISNADMTSCIMNYVKSGESEYSLL